MEVDQPFPTTGAEADLYLVHDRQGSQFVAKIYRLGIRPKEEVRTILQDAASNHVIRTVEHGTSGDGCSWELLEYAALGSLRELIDREGPKMAADATRRILMELNGALSHVHSLGIEHQDLKPENILIRTREPLDLVLTDFGISSSMKATIQFTKAHRTERYAPPEGMSGTVVKTRWDYWSLGVVIVELLTGKRPFHDIEDDKRVAAVLFSESSDRLTQEVEDDDWRKLCQGLLRRNPADRWGDDQVQRWLRNPKDRSLTVADEAHTTSRRPPFLFVGRPCTNPEELAGALAENWSGGLDLWHERHQALKAWLRHDLGELVLADVLGSIASAPGPAADKQLFSLIHALHPRRTPSFKGRDVTADSIAEAGEQAILGDEALINWLGELQEHDILALACQLPQSESALGDVVSRWNNAIHDYELGASKVTEASGGTASPPGLDGLRIRSLLGAASQGGRALDVLREQAAAAYTRSAASRLWFSQLGAPRRATPAAALLITVLAPIAESQVEASRKDRAQRNGMLWREMASGGFVAGIGAFLWWMAADAYCKGSHQSCTTASWHIQSITVLDSVLLTGALVASLAILVVVDRRTAGRG